MAKRIIIADIQQEYVERLQAYLQKAYTGRYDIEVFDDKAKLVKHIATQKCDILLLAPQLYDQTLNLKHIKLPIILQKDHEILPSHEKLKWVIPKYTRVSTMVNYIEAQFEEVERNRPLIYSMYSPAGGVGQTTMALAVALSYAQQNKKVMYVNLEAVDSTDMFMDTKSVLTKENLSKVGENKEIQFLREHIQQDPKTHIMCVKYHEIQWPNGLYENIGDMIEKIIDCEIANIVVVDLGHAYDSLQKDLMEQSDYVLMVDDGRTHSQFKINQVLKQTQGTMLLNEKVRRVLNQAQERENDLPLEIVGKIDNVYSATPMGVCEAIAKNKALKLHGLV